MMKVSIAISVFIAISSSLRQIRAGPPLQLKALQGFEDEDTIKTRQIDGIRLNNNVVPFHYDLDIRPIIDLPETDPQQFTAPGEVTIHVRGVLEGDTINLHSDEISIQEDNVSVTETDTGIALAVSSFQNQTEGSIFTITTSTNLMPGKEYMIRIPFTALVGDRLSGLYRSSYLDENGNLKWLATTQFQKLGARQAFPCFDEPALKATFSIRVGRKDGYNTLCNAKIATTIPIPGLPEWNWDVYEKTVIMSTYLIAIIVSDFVSVQASSELSKYDVRTWGPPSITTDASAEFSALAAANIVTYFEEYYDSPYQFPKLYSVAVPDFDAGAMENWALNTYRTIFMLWFEGESTQFEQWRESAVIAHEISHHWFGDLVTCDWWNDLWLNEGFARYMQFIGASNSGKDFGVLDRYVLDVMQLALDADASANSEPVHSNVTNQVVSQPTRVIYEKGAALIRLMQAFLTETTLITGLQKYLKKYQYSTAIQDYLFEELQAQAIIDGTAAAFSVKEIMDSWTLKKGFPLVRISRAAPTRIYVSQERFVLPEDRGEQVDTELWYLPVSYASQTNPDLFSANVQPKFWLDKYTILAIETIPEPLEQWILVNHDARYFYRVIYDEHFYSLIQAQLVQEHKLFSLSSRSQLIDDYFKSAYAEYVSIQKALNLTVYLDKEDENTVWTTVFNNFARVKQYLKDQSSYTPFKNYLLKLIIPTLTRIGVRQEPTDAAVTVFLRAQLLDWACSLGSVECDDVTDLYVNDWVGDPANNRIPADIQPMIFCSAMANSTVSNISDLVLEQYQMSTRAERQQIFINALACESDEARIAALLQQTVTEPSGINKKLHGVALIQRISETSLGREKVLQFLESDAIKIIQE